MEEEKHGMPEEERRELEALRREKSLRLQEDRAEAALREAGVSGIFAPLLAGADDADTDRRTERFCAAYREAVSEAVRGFLPRETPAVADPDPCRMPRGIRRIR